VKTRSSREPIQHKVQRKEGYNPPPVAHVQRPVPSPPPPPKILNVRVILTSENDDHP
jgi:hypothetical protein